jgi:exodeoxyribonuclease VIII
MTVMDAEQGRKLQLMRESVMAHHAARFFLEADGHCESSFYWSDAETEELCRIRPDKYLTNRPLIVDVKKVSDMSRFARHIEAFRYHVQAAMYCEGFYHCTGTYPQFVFIAVSEAIDCGRYPVRVFELHDNDMSAGSALFRRDLCTFHSCRLGNNWGGIEIIQRPAWAH